MTGKNNEYLKGLKEGTKVETYSIKKFKVGTASVVIGASIFLGAGAVAQASEEVSNNTTADNTTNAGEKAEAAPKAVAQPEKAENTKESVAAAVAAKVGVEAPKTEVKQEVAVEVKLDKSGLEAYINEVSANLEAGKYANKTDESVAVLKADLESAKATLANAKIQDELKAAYNKLVTTVNSKLKNKPVEKKETPAVDTTNGKETVGKKAENTESSAANSHATNAKAEEGTGFRRNDSGSPQVTSTVNYEDASYVRRNGVTSADTSLSGTGTNGKTVVVTVATPGGATKIYETVVKNGKWTVNLEAPLKSGSDPYNKGTDETKVTVQYKGENNKLNDETRVYLGRPKFANDTVVAGQKEVLVKVPKDANNLWVGFTGSWDRQVIMNGGNPQSQDASTLTATMADTQDDPIFHIVKLTFLKNAIKEGANGINLQAQSGYSAAGGAKPGTTEAAEAKRLALTATNEAPTIAATNNGSDVVVKKGEAFDIATLATVADKEDDAKLTVGEPVKAKLVSVNGASATTFSTATPGEYTLVLKAVDSQGKDSANTITRKVIVRENQAPTAEIPFSDPAPDKKEIFVYGAEENSFDIKIKDDSGKIVSATVRGGSNQEFKPVEGETNKINTQYGFTANTFSAETTASEDSPAVITYSGTPAPEGNFTLDKLKAATKGENPAGVALGWRYVRATDADGGEIAGVGTSAADIGAFRVMLKPQTQKYDIQSPADADKVAVTDPSAVTDDEFNKIKEKLKIEYSKTNPDKNLEAKRGQEVAEKDERIDTITKVGTDLVVTYKDGSVDKKPLSEFVNLNKQPAIDAVNKAAEDKIDEINKTPNATDEEKAAAIAKVNADKEKAVAAINNANVTTKAELDKAKEAGSTAIAADNPVVTKKDSAKADVEAARKAKADAITADKNLSQAEKDAAIAKINKAAEDATKAIDAATTDAAVDTAKNTGTTEFGKVNPIAKENAKEAIANALTAKNNEIDARTDLTQAEKDAAKAEAKKLADAELAKVEAQPDNAETADAAATAQKIVNDAEDKGVADVTAVHPIAKEQAKLAVADELAKKEAEIDARTDLTKEEKDAAKKEAQDKAKAATDAINAQPAIADSEDKATAAQQAVDTAKNTGISEVKAVNPEAKAKPAAKKAIDDKLAEQLKAIENTPDATDEEKKVASDAARAIAEQAKKEIDAAKSDADVKTLEDEAKAEIEKSLPLVEDKPNARKAIDEEAKAKKAEIDARNDLSPKAKEALKAKVDKVANKAKAAIDAVSSVEDVNVIEEADKAAIKAIGDINRPIDKVLVKDPSALTDEEKAKILEEVKRVNPTAKEVKYNENGKIEVTTGNGDKGTINPAKLVKTEEDLDNGKGGNDINKPLDKVIVKDPANLTDEEKAKIVAKVEEVNPDAIVTIDENGTVSVSTPDGKTSAIPASDLVRTKEDTEKAGAGNSNIVKPADKVVGEANDPDDQAKVEAKLRELNPETKSVKFDENGNATVTLKDGTTATIPSEDLFRSETDVNKPNAGNDVVKPADKTLVKDPNALTDEEKAEIAAKVKEVNPDSTVVVDDKGNATVTTKDGKTAVIPGKDLVKTEADAAKPNAGNDIVKPADKTLVKDPNALTDEEKAAIAAKVKEVNPDSTVVVDDKGNATVTTKDGKTAVIPGKDLVKTEVDAAKPNAGNDIVKPAYKTLAKDPNALTDEEKAAIAAKVKEVNPDSTVVVDDKGNATVTTKDGKTAVIPGKDLVKTEADAAKPNAGNDVVKPADKTLVKDPAKLTDEEKAAIAAKVKEVNPDSIVVVDDKGNATVTTKDGKTAVIPGKDLVKTEADAVKPNGGNDIVKPADKTLVKDPNALTDEEKAEIAAKVKEVNPDSTVVVDDKGNATVTTPDGKTAVIPGKDLVKTEADAAKPNAGNDVVKPADKTLVKDPAKLTDEEKAAIAAKVKEVNPGATVVIDDKGNATVTTPDGKTAVIPGKDLVKTEADAAKPNAGNDIVKPADKTLVKDPAKLTDEEKAAIAAKVKEVNPDSTVVIDDKGNATVTTKDGKTAIIPGKDLVKTEADAAKPNAGNDVVKPADKTLVKDPAKLTDEEKAAIVAKVKEVNPDSTVVVDDKGNATVTTKDGKTAVIPGKDLVKTEADAAKPNAGNDIVKPADKTLVKDPNALTDEEKAEIAAKVKEVNPGATVVIDDKGNATVTTPEGKTAVIPGKDLVKTEADAVKPKAGNDVVKPADKTLVKDPAKLTDEEKAAIVAKVKEVNPDSTVVVDDKGNATVTTKDGKTAVIPGKDLVKTEADAAKPNAGNDIVKPADKTLVKDPNALTDEEKAAIAAKVKEVNPDSTVVVDDKGNATVTTKDGKTAVIPGKDLVKTEADLGKENAGNDINTPTAKTAVANKDALTDAEKEAVKKAVEAVNPGATVVIDDKGNATVTTKDGKVAVIPASKLVIPADKVTDVAAQSGINTPATRTLVANKDSLTPEEIAKIKAAVEEVNPGAIVVVDAKGNATVTTKDGVTATIAAEQLVKDANDVAAKNNGENINLDFEKQTVADLDNLTDADKAGAKDKIIAANPNVAEVIFDAKGNATVILKDGKTYTILAKDIFKKAEEQTSPMINIPEKVQVGDLTNLTDVEKEAVKQALIKANPELKEAKITVSATGETTIVYPDGRVVVIPAEKLVETKGSNGQSNDNGGNNRASADKATNSKLGQRLANTGTTETNTGLAGLGMAILGGLLAARRRKNDKN